MKMTKIYDRVEKIFAKKGKDSKYPKKKFVHTFKLKVSMYGLENGNILLKSPKGHRLWGYFS